MGRLDGRVALVTGGTAGIGEAAVRRFAAEGASVVFTGSNVAAATALEAATGAWFVKHDVADAETWPALMSAIKDRHHRLDIAFANAGIEGKDTNIEDIEIAAWREVLDVNLTGVMLTCQHSIRLMKQNPGGSSGSIIINSSINGIMALPGNVAYTTTKGAVRLLSKSVAVYCARQGLHIRCNSVHPGVIDTPIIRRAIAGAPDSDGARKFLEGISPMRRLGTSEEVATVVAFLASDEASLMNGAEVVADGGSIAGLVGV
jgi:NAD(P)-dependent dehydrogenase (short-subunit alcohol dehydrogenase family)